MVTGYVRDLMYKMYTITHSPNCRKLYLSSDEREHILTQQTVARDFGHLLTGPDAVVTCPDGLGIEITYCGKLFKNGKYVFYEISNMLEDETLDEYPEAHTLNILPLIFENARNCAVMTSSNADRGNNLYWCVDGVWHQNGYGGIIPVMCAFKDLDVVYDRRVGTDYTPMIYLQFDEDDFAAGRITIHRCERTSNSNGNLSIFMNGIEEFLDRDNAVAWLVLYTPTNSFAKQYHAVIYSDINTTGADIRSYLLERHIYVSDCDNRRKEATDIDGNRIILNETCRDCFPFSIYGVPDDIMKKEFKVY